MLLHTAPVMNGFQRKISSIALWRFSTNFNCGFLLLFSPFLIHLCNFIFVMFDRIWNVVRDKIVNVTEGLIRFVDS